LQYRVVFGGHVQEEMKNTCFAEADVCVVPSYSENFGMVVLESLAHGVPVIASKGSPWSRIEEKGCGFWVDNTPEILADAVMRIRRHDLQAMGQSGVRWVKEQFSWQLIAQDMHELYRQLISVSI
jgi:glycosyltransferase involved in cell wall biosynthesis